MLVRHCRSLLVNFLPPAVQLRNDALNAAFDIRVCVRFLIFFCYVLVPYTRSGLAPPLIHAHLVIVEVVNMAPAISKLASDVQRYKGPVLAACGGVALAYAWLKSYGIQVG